MCSVMKENFAFDFWYTERSFFTLNTSLKKMLLFQGGKSLKVHFCTLNTSPQKNVAFSRGKVTEGSSLYTEHFTRKKCCFFKRKNHWRFTFFSEHINDLKISNLWFFGGRGGYLFSDSSRTDQWKLTCISDSSQKQFSFLSHQKTSWTGSNMQNR